MAYWDFNYLPRRTAPAKLLCDKTFRLLKIRTEAGNNSEVVIETQKLVEELHKPIVQKKNKNLNYFYSLKTTFGVPLQQIFN